MVVLVIRNKINLDVILVKPDISLKEYHTIISESVSPLIEVSCNSSQLCGY